MDVWKPKINDMNKATKNLEDDSVQDWSHARLIINVPETPMEHRLYDLDHDKECDSEGKIGNLIALVEYDIKGNPICGKFIFIDGIIIKNDVWYILKNNNFVEFKE